MVEVTNPQDAKAALEQRVEALAMQLLMEGSQIADGRRWSDALAALAVAAEAEGQRGIASLAWEVAAQVDSAPAPDKTRACFENGILRLQEAL